MNLNIGYSPEFALSAMKKKKEYYKTRLYNPDVLAYSSKQPQQFNRTSTPKAPVRAYEKLGVAYYSDFNAFAERKRLKPESHRALEFWREYLQRDSMIHDGSYIHARNKVFIKNLQTTISRTFGENKETEKLAREIRYNFNKLSDEDIYKLTTVSGLPSDNSQTIADVFSLSQLYNAIASDEGESVLLSSLKTLFKRAGKEFTEITEKDSTQFTPAHVRSVYIDIKSNLTAPLSENERRQAEFSRQTDPLLRKNTVGFTASEVLSFTTLQLAGYSASQARGIMAEIRAQRSAVYKPTLYFTRDGELRGNFLSANDAKVVLDFFKKNRG